MNENNQSQAMLGVDVTAQSEASAPSAKDPAKHDCSACGSKCKWEGEDIFRCSKPTCAKVMRGVPVKPTPADLATLEMQNEAREMLYQAARKEHIAELCKKLNAHGLLLASGVGSYKVDISEAMDALHCLLMLIWEQNIPDEDISRVSGSITNAQITRAVMHPQYLGAEKHIAALLDALNCYASGARDQILTEHNLDEEGLPIPAEGGNLKVRPKWVDEHAKTCDKWPMEPVPADTQPLINHYPASPKPATFRSESSWNGESDHSFYRRKNKCNNRNEKNWGCWNKVGHTGKCSWDK